MALTANATVALAGRSAFAWARDAETLGEGDLEIEQWLWARALPHGGADTSGWVHLAPVVGVTDKVELEMPWNLEIDRTGTRITDFGAAARIGFLDRFDDEWIRPVLRVAYQQNFAHPDNHGRWLVPWARLNLAVSIGDLSGSHLTIDAGAYSDLEFGKRQVAGHTLGIGYIHEVLDNLRVGGEYYHDLGFGRLNHDRYQIYLGPSVAYSHHRLWAALSVLIGLTDDGPRLMPRAMVGIVL